MHIVLAFVLGLYLGYIVELTGSALPAITCHIANNVLYTLQTALGVAVPGRRANLIAAPIAAAVFVGCVLVAAPRGAAGAAAAAASVSLAAPAPLAVP